MIWKSSISHEQLWTATAPEILPAFSEPRLSTYLKHAHGDKLSAFRLHHFNACVSASFWEPLELFEIILRNRLSDCLQQTFGPNWPTQEVFSKILTSEARSMLNEALQTTSRSKLQASTTDDVISNLKFAFWEKLLTNKLHRHIWEATLSSRFPLYTKDTNSLRIELQKTAAQIRRFRNRVAHHEPIFAEDLMRQYRRIHRTIRYAFPYMATWLNNTQTITRTLQEFDWTPPFTRSSGVHH